MNDESTPTTDPTLTYDIERFVLGGVVIKPEALGETWFLEAAAFVDAYHRRVFLAIRSLAAQDEPFDLVAIRHELEHDGGQSDPGRLGRLIDIIGPTSRNIRAHARRIYHRHLRAKLATEPATDADLLRDYASRLDQADDDRGADMVDMETLAHETVERLHNPPAPVAVSGLTALDKLTGGFFRGQLVLVAARPSLGKTALLVRIALEAGQLGSRVAFVTAEMARHEIFMRLLAMVARADLHAYTTQRQEWTPALNHAAELVSALPIDVCDLADGGSRPTDIEARFQARHYDLVLVDYIGLLRPDSRQESRNLEVSSICAALKRMAKERNVAVVAASQLSRAAARTDLPSLSDLRDSGSLEQDADVVVFIGKHEPGETSVRLSVAKNRNGPVGLTSVLWHARWASFENHSGRED